LTTSVGQFVPFGMGEQVPHGLDSQVSAEGALWEGATAPRRDLSGSRDSAILEGHLCPDHVHVYISIPPKYAVFQVIGYIKGKSGVHQGQERNCYCQELWRPHLELHG
jgi:hypothetical protein